MNKCWLLCLLIAVNACAGKQVKDLDKEEYNNLERLSINLDSVDDNPLQRGAILSVIMFNSADIESCYQKVSKNDPKITGKIKTFFTIARNGKMTDFKILDTTLHSKGVEDCVEHAFRKMDFPPNDYMIDVTHSIKFNKAED
jgi:hypothetical protein